MYRKEDYIAVFDSGVGGISVLRQLRKLMPHENYIYYGDSANAPYGSRTTEEVRALTLAAAEKLTTEYPVKALVIACNTATAAAIEVLRETYPDLIVIGIEPAVKLAADHFPGGRLGVMATEVTLREEKFDALVHRFDRECTITKIPAPGLVQLIEAGKVDTIITKDLSRLGRDYILTGHYLERYFPEHRVRYISLLDGIDTAIDSSANDITPFRAIMNDMYAKDISKKITSVKRSQQRRGLFIGGKPVYGYRKHPSDKNRLIVDEDAALVVRRIFSMAYSGTSCREIASTLNREHIPPPALYAGLTVTGSKSYTGLWSGERISEMLQNETYIGNMVQGRRVKSSYKSRKCLRQRKEDWVDVLLERYPIKAGDVLISISNSGRNAVPLEMAMAARERGTKVICITNLAQSSQAVSRHSSGLRLFELSDIVIDNCGAVGDAAMTIGPNTCGPTSTVIGAAILQAIVCGVVEELQRRGIAPEVFCSSNVDGGDEINHRWIEQYRREIPIL